MICDSGISKVVGAGVFCLATLHFGRFSSVFHIVIPQNAIIENLQKSKIANDSSELSLCPNPNFDTLTEWISYFDGDGNEASRGLKLLPGGRWSPPCQSRFSHTHLILPYRDRKPQLEAFLLHIHPFLQAQNLSYSVTVVEQAAGKAFNRAKLFNVGFAESSRSEGDCFIFHDVDLIPLDGRNLYACLSGGRPRHLTSHLDLFRYNLMYPELFGGASAISAETFVKVDGFANTYYGWGGEDDDMSQNRLAKHGLPIYRFDSAISRYRGLQHVQAEKNPHSYTRFKYETKGLADGLSNLEYTVTSNANMNLYKHLIVQL